MNLRLFTLPSCFPCVQMKTFLHANSIPFEEVNLIENPEAAAAAKVDGAPTLLIMDGASELERIAGYSPMQLEWLLELVDKR